MIEKYFSKEKYREIKNSNNLFYKTLEIVIKLFEDDKDKGSWPYILHLISVYKSVDTEEEKIIALLHDIMEDKNVSKEELLSLGYSNNIVDAVDMLTKKDGIEYQEYIDNLVKLASKEALKVKKADLENNMDITRISNPTEKDYERIEKKYKPAYEKINNRLKEMEK